MNITKTALALQQAEGVSPEELELINTWSKKPLTAQEVYVFSVRLCDNEVDRDFERFPAQTLEALAPLFLGKSGIFDHNWSARNQSARIFSTQVIQEPERVTQAEDPYCWLKARAYMVRTDDNRGLIAEIDGGIKKEVSVGCAVKRRVCSICGEEAGTGCGHQPGQVYDGKLCYLSLEEPADAYEFSFVAVPAQPQAGVVKAMGGKHYETLKELLADYPRFAGEVEALKDKAELGVRALKELREDVVRLAALADPQADMKVLQRMAQHLEEPELRQLQRLYGQKAAKNYPLQLPYAQKSQSLSQEDGAFLI